MRILTGSTGTNHVTAADDGALHAGLAGKNGYVLNVGQKFKATVKSATSIQLADGDGVLNGRHFRTELGSSDTVAIAENSAGMNRNDIIGVKYSMSSGVESMAWQVIKGTATTGTAADPTYSSGDLLAGGNTAFMPMYRVKLSGASISAVETMYTVLPTLDELGKKTDPLGISHGGTGSTTAANARTALGVTPANIGAATSGHSHALTASTITGTLPITKGGTGSTSAANARTALGITPANIGAAAEGHTHALTASTITGTLPITKGGTGSTTAAAARTALGITPANIGALASEDYDGLINKSGNAASATLKEGRGISVITKVKPAQGGSGDPSPDNVRPISGWTGAKLTRCGKNLLEYTSVTAQTTTENGVTYTVNSDGSITVNGTATGTSILTLTSSGSNTRLRNALLGNQITLSGCPSGGSTSTYALRFFQPAGSDSRADDTGSGVTTTFTNNDIGYNVAIIVWSGTTVSNLVFRPMLRLASETDATFEPYTGDTYTANFGQTVYGGTLDWATGVLTVDRALKTFTGSEYWEKSSATTSDRFISPITGALAGSDVICSHGNGGGGLNDLNHCYITASSNFAWNYSAYGSTTVDKFKEYLAAQNTAGTPVQVAYKLAAPTTIQLTPQEITALEGVNTVYSDCGDGDVSFNHDDLIRLTGTLPIAKGGTGATTAADARTALGITPSNIGAAAQSAFKYSTTEVTTAAKWLDGKTIYRKVFQFGAIAAGGSTSIDTGLGTSLDTVVSLRGMARLTDSNYVAPLPYSDTDTKYLYKVQIIEANSAPKISIGAGASGGAGFTGGFVVLEYTKK